MMENKEQYKAHLDAWADLLRHQYFFKNTDYIKNRINKLEADIRKLDSNPTLDNIISSSGMKKAKIELENVLTYYKFVIEEKLQYDKTQNHHADYNQKGR